MNRSQLESAVCSVLSTIFACPIDGASTRADLPAWDSLKHIQCVFALEDELSVTFCEEQIAELDSVTKIVDSIAAYHAS